MTYDEALVIVEELRGHDRAPFSIEDKQRIEEIYPMIMGRRFRKTSCKRCYHDAVIEMAVKLRRTKKMERYEKCDYRMRAGFIIHTPAIDGGKIYTNANLTNEVAKRYLELFPQKRVMFEQVPEETAEKPVEAPEESKQASDQPKAEKPKKGRSSRKKAKK